MRLIPDIGQSAINLNNDLTKFIQTFDIYTMQKYPENFFLSAFLHVPGNIHFGEETNPLVFLRSVGNWWCKRLNQG